MSGLPDDVSLLPSFGPRPKQSKFAVDAPFDAYTSVLKVWTIAYQLIFRKKFRGESRWRTYAGLLATMA